MIPPDELQDLIDGSKLLTLIKQTEYDNLMEMARLTKAVMENVEKYVELEKIKDPAKRAAYIKQHALPSINWRNYVATSLNQNQQQVIQSVAKINKMAPELVEEIFREAGALSYSYDVSPFKLAFEAGVISEIPPPTLARNPQFQKILEAGYKQTLREVEGWVRPKGRNFTGTTAISTEQYRNLHTVFDRAYQQVAVGGFTVEQAVRNAVHMLAEDNFKFVEYRNEGKRPHRNRLDTACRRALLTGINQTCGIMTEDMGEQYGGTTVETTAHLYARDTGTGFQNHLLWQGRWFSWKGRNPDYPDFHESCGYGEIQGILGINCRHSYLWVFPGISEHAYNPDDYIVPDVMYNGKKYTGYQATQVLRDLEVKKRAWLDKSNAAKAAGLDNSQEQGRIRELNRKIKDFCEQTKIKRQPNRERPVS